MHPTLIRLSLAGLVAVSFSPLGRAQPSVPATIPFQASLADTSGTPVADGVYPMTFRLYKNAIGGSALWTEVRTSINSVDVEAGQFDVRLGEVASLANVSFDEPLFLGLAVGSDPEMTPRTPLGSSPYALGLKNVYPSASTVHIDAPAGVGLNTTSIRSLFTIRGPDDRIAGPVQFMFGNSSDQTESGRIRFVEGTATTNWRGGYIHYDGQANKLHLGIHNSSDSLLANDKNVITIERTSSRQVGIGTETPNRELTVNDTDASGDAFINVTAPSRELLLGVNPSSGGIVGMQTNNDLQFRTNGTIRMVVESGGDVQARNDLVVEGEILKDYGSSDYSLAVPFAMARIDADDEKFIVKTPNLASVIRNSGGSWVFFTNLDCTTPAEGDAYLVQVTVEESGVDDVVGQAACAGDASCPTPGNCIRFVVQTRSVLGAQRVNFNMVIYRID